MSTTFGIKVQSIGEIVEVAHRHSIGNNEVQITILNPLLYLVKSDTEVIPMDNTAQGIETVNDIFNNKNIVNRFM